MTISTEETALDHLVVKPRSQVNVGGNLYLVLEGYEEIKAALNEGMTIGGPEAESAQMDFSMTAHREFHTFASTGLLRIMFNMAQVVTVQEVDADTAERFRLAPDGSYANPEAAFGSPA